MSVDNHTECMERAYLTQKGKQMTQKGKEVFYGISVKIWLHNIDQMAIAPFSAGGYSMSYGLFKKNKFTINLL